MEALFVLLIFSLILGAGFLGAFLWAQRSGQFDDTETPALRMLFDETDAKREKALNRNTSPLDTSFNKGDLHGS